MSSIYQELMRKEGKGLMLGAAMAAGSVRYLFVYTGLNAFLHYTKVREINHEIGTM